MARHVKNYTGKKFGTLTVVGMLPRNIGDGNARWLCICDCGNRIVVTSGNFHRRNTCSAKCVNRGGEATHKHGAASNTASAELRITYKSWSAMKARCLSPTAKDYGRYGGRGITVCDRWRDSFEAFMADMGFRPSSQYTLDREDNYGNYEPSNCRWATPTEQSNNRRSNRTITFNGDTLTLAQWSRRVGLPEAAIAGRLDAGWPVERAMTHQLRKAKQAPVDIAVETVTSQPGLF